MSFKAFSRDLGSNKISSIKSKRSQSALEYMMTYGWAILIIVIVAVILYSMGIFNPSSSITTTITGFQSLGVTQANCINSVNNQILELYITNNVGYPVNITSINVTGNNGLKVTQDVGSTLNPGASSSFYVNGACNKSSSSYSGSATITYTEPGQPLPGPYVSTGSLVKVPVNSNPNQVASFNGASSYIITTLPFKSDSFTVVYWVNGRNTSKMTSGSGYTTFGSNGTDFITSWLNNGGASCGTGDEEIAVSIPGLSDDHGLGVSGGIWTMVTISVNKGVVTYYVNSTGPCVGSTISNEIYSLDYLTFGYNPDNGNSYGLNPFNGTLTNFQVYNTVLTPNLVNELFSSSIGGAPIPSHGLVGWWPLDGNANDYSGNNNNGVPTDINWVSP